MNKQREKTEITKHTHVCRALIHEFSTFFLEYVVSLVNSYNNNYDRLSIVFIFQCYYKYTSQYNNIGINWHASLLPYILEKCVLVIYSYNRRMRPGQDQCSVRLTRSLWTLVFREHELRLRPPLFHREKTRYRCFAVLVGSRNELLSNVYNNNT